MKAWGRIESTSKKQQEGGVRDATLVAVRHGSATAECPGRSFAWRRRVGVFAGAAPSLWEGSYFFSSSGPGLPRRPSIRF